MKVFMHNKISTSYIFLIIILSSIATCPFKKTPTSNKYEIKFLDRSNQEQVQQVLKLFANSSIQSMGKPTQKDLKKWITSSVNDVLLVINTKGLVCGAVIYFISQNQELWLRTIALSDAHQWRNIAIKLLQRLELVPHKIKIGTIVRKKKIALYKIFKKLGYTQTEQFLNMNKPINNSSIRDSQTSNFIIKPLDSTNPKEIELFSQLFDANEVGMEWTPEEMQEFTTHKNYQFLATFDDHNQLCGGLIYHVLSTHWKIYALSVHKNYRHCGIATELIRFLEEQALHKNIGLITLSVLPNNYAAMACYKKQGFIEKEIICKMIKEMHD